MAKHIFVTGGVVSSLGKGITAASLGRLLKSRGVKVVLQKLDPYLNVDPGIMSPFQHGEVYVTDDGAEADLDLGHYERFIDENLTTYAEVTGGAIYQSLIERERAGLFGSGTVQVVPHLTNEIKNRILTLAQESQADVVITEIGGTVGDIESLHFVEAARQMRNDLGPGNSCHIHATLLPYVSASRELKTKPTQHSVQKLRELGIHPDFIVCRSEHPISEDEIAKISLFCDVTKEHVLACLDAPSIYSVPLALREQNFDILVARILGLTISDSDLRDWEEYNEISQNLCDEVRVAMVGKYVTLPDAYLSAIEGLLHSGVYHNHKIVIGWLDSEVLTPEEIEAKLAGGNYDGIIAPGGFGVDFIDGNLVAARFARENNVPYLGLCLGMQTAIIDFARNVAGLVGANSTEFDKDTAHPVIVLGGTGNPEMRSETIRLGSAPLVLEEGTKIARAYGLLRADERHRNHYEVNSDYVLLLKEAGLIISATSPDGTLIEAIELPDHPWFVGVQPHVEYKSRPTRPAPLLRDFVQATIAARQGKL